MMHMRVTSEAASARPRGYSPRRINPVALGLVFPGHAILIVLALTYRFTIAEQQRQPPLIVNQLDLEPPPASEPDRPAPEPEPTRLPVPRPPLFLQLPQQPVVPVTLETPAPQPVPQAAPAPASSPAPPAPQPVAAGDLSSSMIDAPPPRYPVESRRKREQGTVVLAVLLSTDGRVADIRISRSSGYPRLDDAALRAVRRWRWSPTTRGGVAVQVRGTVEIPFILTN